MGVFAVEGCVRVFETAVGANVDDLAKKEKSFLRNAEDLVKYCDPTMNPTSFRACQESAAESIDGLLTVAQNASRAETRIACFQALARLTFGMPDNASAVAASASLLPAVTQVFRPIVDFVQQQEHAAALLVVQALAAQVPEAPNVAALLPLVVSLASGGQGDGVAPDRSVRTLSVEVMVPCAFASSRRAQLTRLLPAHLLEPLLARAQGEDAHAQGFAMGLIVAALSPCILYDDLGPTEITVGEFGRDFLLQTDFFSNFTACIQATVDGQPYPEGSGVYHRTWKLATASAQLVVAGFTVETTAFVPALLALALEPSRVILSNPQEEIEGLPVPLADDVIASHRAVEALYGLRGVAAAVAQMVAAEHLKPALRNMRDVKAASDLLTFLEEGGDSVLLAEGEVHTHDVSAVPSV